MSTDIHFPARSASRRITRCAAFVDAMHHEPELAHVAEVLAYLMHEAERGQVAQMKLEASEAERARLADQVEGLAATVAYLADQVAALQADPRLADFLDGVEPIPDEELRDYSFLGTPIDTAAA